MRGERPGYTLQTTALLHEAYLRLRRTQNAEWQGRTHFLAAADERKAKVVELRFFGGLTVEETADVLEISPETVMRDWKHAKVWLKAELSGAPHET